MLLELPPIFACSWTETGGRWFASQGMYFKLRSFVMDRYSFLVRLFHPLLDSGLSRRTNIAIALTLRPVSNGSDVN